MTRDEKLARIKELVEQNPPSDAEVEQGLDDLIADLEGTAAPKGIIGAAVIGAIIGGAIARR